MNNDTASMEEKVSVILDTDIGDDIDDTWALAMLLKSPEVDLRMVVTDYDNTEWRAKIVAKMLEIAGRTDVPVGIGVKQSDNVGQQGPWVEDYDLSTYPGTVHRDGVGAMIDEIMSSDGEITLLCIGPVPNIGEALRREPRIAEKARFVGMHGSVHKGYGGRAEIDAEWNVRCCTPDCQVAFSALWNMTITPVDTCGIVTLEGEKYARVRDCTDPVTAALIENYRIWADGRDEDAESRSSVLFDTVAVYLAFSEDLLVMEDLGIRVTDDGFTVIDDTAKVVRCATDWKDLSAFEDLLVARLTGRDV